MHRPQPQLRIVHALGARRNRLHCRRLSRHPSNYTAARTCIPPLHQLLHAERYRVHAFMSSVRRPVQPATWTSWSCEVPVRSAKSVIQNEKHITCLCRGQFRLSCLVLVSFFVFRRFRRQHSTMQIPLSLLSFRTHSRTQARRERGPKVGWQNPLLSRLHGCLQQQLFLLQTRYRRSQKGPRGGRIRRVSASSSRRTEAWMVCLVRLLIYDVCLVGDRLDDAAE